MLIIRVILLIESVLIHIAQLIEVFNPLNIRKCSYNMWICSDDISGYAARICLYAGKYAGMRIYAVCNSDGLLFFWAGLGDSIAFRSRYKFAIQLCNITMG